MKLLMTIILTLTTHTVFASCQLTAEQFVDLDIKSRTFTLDGMQQRLTLLEQDANDYLMHQSDQDIYQRVKAVFDDVNCTPAQHARFGSEYAGEITIYLLSNPELQSQLEQLESNFAHLSSSIRALSEATVNDGDTVE